MKDAKVVEAVPVGQFTVSARLSSSPRPPLSSPSRGTARLYRINGTCVECFPTAADLVMGQPSPIPPAPR